MKKIALALPLVAFLVGCAATPELKEYPRRQIDRPYTLPKGVTQWKTLMVVGYARDNSNQESFLPPIPVPLFWDHSLSDDWTLHWLGLPLAISHQLSYSKDSVWGIQGSLGLGYASGSTGFIFQPNLSLYQRTRIESDIALEFIPRTTWSFKTGGAETNYIFGLDIGFLLQVTDTLAATFHLSPSLAKGFTSGYVSSFTVTPTNVARFTLPFRLGVQWSLDRQWDLNIDYTLRHLGQDNGFVAHEGIINVIHSW